MAQSGIRNMGDPYSNLHSGKRCTNTTLNHMAQTRLWDQIPFIVTGDPIANRADGSEEIRLVDCLENSSSLEYVCILPH